MLTQSKKKSKTMKKKKKHNSEIFRYLYILNDVFDNVVNWLWKSCQRYKREKRLSVDIQS